jgi:Ca-activated chloride channel family protein
MPAARRREFSMTGLFRRPAMQFATVSVLALAVASPWLYSLSGFPLSKQSSAVAPKTNTIQGELAPAQGVVREAPEVAQQSSPAAAPPPAPVAPNAPQANFQTRKRAQIAAEVLSPGIAPQPAPAPLQEYATRSHSQEPIARSARDRRGGSSFQPATSAPAIAGSDADKRQLAAPGGSVVTSERYAPAYQRPAENRDQFANAPVNGFKDVMQDAVSTFSIDVDTASYSVVRSQLTRYQLPSPQSVRTEELINYFPYDYARPASANEPFATDVSVMPNPWAKGRKLMRIGIQGYQIKAEERPPANLVFLVDTSGSMDGPNRLPLVRRSLEMLVETLRPEDRVAIVAYAGSAGTVLEPTTASNKNQILAALDNLKAGGSTAGGEGLQLAYRLAERNFDPKAVNRIMLATDGDFNVGITNRDELKGFVESKRDKGIFLSVLGFGMGNLNDSLMQALAQNGNGVAAYIDTLAEARKVMVDQASTTLFPIAKDVKIQVEFNPAMVSEYRLVGYETRLLNRDDFNNDKVDAGDVGSGASVTAIYDIVPKGAPRLMDESRYQPEAARRSAEATPQAGEYAYLKIRYKLPQATTSTLMAQPITPKNEVTEISQAPESARFAVAVASFGEYLRNAAQMGDVKLEAIIDLANAAKGADTYGYRAEFVSLVRAAQMAKGNR